MAFYGDTDSQETQEWQDAFDAVLQHMGTERAAFLLEKLYQRAIAKHVPIQRLNTPYLNTISVEEQPAMPGDPGYGASYSCLDSLECVGNGIACQ